MPAMQVDDDLIIALEFGLMERRRYPSKKQRVAQEPIATALLRVKRVRGCSMQASIAELAYLIQAFKPAR